MKMSRKRKRRKRCLERNIGRPRRRCALCLAFPTKRARLNLHLHLEKMGKMISASAGRANSLTEEKMKLHSKKIWKDESKHGSCMPAVALDSHQKATLRKHNSSDMIRITIALRFRSKKTSVCIVSPPQRHHLRHAHGRRGHRCRRACWIPEVVVAWRSKQAYRPFTSCTRLLNRCHVWDQLRSFHYQHLRH